RDATSSAVPDRLHLRTSRGSPGRQVSQDEGQPLTKTTTTRGRSKSITRPKRSSSSSSLKSNVSPVGKEGGIAKDARGIALLTLLYFIQGIPLGLAMGSIPFLLKKKLSYAEMATFSLSSYPYSLKLLWSPIVD